MIIIFVHWLLLLVDICVFASSLNDILDGHFIHGPSNTEMSHPLAAYEPTPTDAGMLSLLRQSTMPAVVGGLSSRSSGASVHPAEVEGCC